MDQNCSNCILFKAYDSNQQYSIGTLPCVHVRNDVKAHSTYVAVTVFSCIEDSVDFTNEDGLFLAAKLLQSRELFYLPSIDSRSARRTKEAKFVVL